MLIEELTRASGEIRKINFRYRLIVMFLKPTPFRVMFVMFLTQRIPVHQLPFHVRHIIFSYLHTRLDGRSIVCSPSATFPTHALQGPRCFCFSYVVAQ